MFLLIALLLGLPGSAPAAPHEAACTIDSILDAIRSTESGGLEDGGSAATGDGGRAIGPFQIHRGYFLDAGVPGQHSDCRDGETARRVVLAYWKRWCPDALERCDAEVLARVHNGGPRGARKPGTLAYWHRVEQQLAAACPRVRLERSQR